MDEKKIDLLAPFIAIRQDVEGDYFTPTMGEYLCNPLTDDLLDVEVSLGGFYSAEELGVLQSNGSVKPVFRVASGAAERFALSTQDEYDEMVVHWSVRYRTNAGARYEASFGSYKRLRDAGYTELTPCLGGPARIIPGKTIRLAA
jgi:hypothetical protein